MQRIKDDDTSFSSKSPPKGSTMKFKTIITTSVLALAGMAHAQSSTPNNPPVASTEANMTPERMVEISSTVGRAYKTWGVDAIIGMENKCWTIFASSKSRDIAASCMATAVSGAFADASIARSQRRSGHPEYQGQALRARMIAKTAALGMNETEAMTMMQDHVLKYQMSILNGLLAAGV